MATRLCFMILSPLPPLQPALRLYQLMFHTVAVEMPSPSMNPGDHAHNSHFLYGEFAPLMVPWKLDTLCYQVIVVVTAGCHSMSLKPSSAEEVESCFCDVYVVCYFCFTATFKF